MRVIQTKLIKDKSLNSKQKLDVEKLKRMAKKALDTGKMPMFKQLIQAQNNGIVKTKILRFIKSLYKQVEFKRNMKSRPKVIFNAYEIDYAKMMSQPSGIFGGRGCTSRV